MTVYVAHEDARRAKDELAAYDSENQAPPVNSERVLPALPRMEVAMVYWAVLLFFFAAARRDLFLLDWVGEGAAQAGVMLNGEWWRAVTALYLHVDAAHLFGNLVFGTVFLLLLAQVTGDHCLRRSERVGAARPGSAPGRICGALPHLQPGPANVVCGWHLCAARRCRRHCA